MERKPIENLKAVSKFNPNTHYEWNPEDIFTVSGSEIDAWNKALATVVNTPEFQRFTVIQRAAIMMNDFIKDGVEQDLIKPRKAAKVDPDAVPEKPVENGSVEQTVG